MDKYDYREAAPHLILMAFLQRVVNDGAHIDREFALGRKRLDLCLHMGAHRYPVELKLYRSAKTEAEGLVQLAEYMDGCGAKEGWLVVFDRHPKRSRSRRIFWRTVEREGKTLHVVGYSDRHDERCTDRLSRVWRWVGPAWYRQRVTIPPRWRTAHGVHRHHVRGLQSYRGCGPACRHGCRYAGLVLRRVGEDCTVLGVGSGTYRLGFAVPDARR